MSSRVDPTPPRFWTFHRLALGGLMILITALTVLWIAGLVWVAIWIAQFAMHFEPTGWLLRKTF